jgi:hypothetical protein
MTINKKLNFIVCGTVRNVGKTLLDDVYRLKDSIAEYNKLDWVLIESDSQDNTLDELNRLKSKLNGFDFITMGNLSDKLPNRIERLVFCRNIYFDYVKEKPKNSYDYVIVMDFDGINNKLNKNSFWSCWSREDWDVVCANQDGPYYDIWALKHKYWNPVDCYQQTKFFGDLTNKTELSTLINVHSKQIIIPKNHDWIEVESAYGGLSIYRFDAFISGESYTPSQEMEIVCDCIPFHKKITDTGFKIFINPKLINADYTEHTNWLRPGFRRFKLTTMIIIVLLFGSRADKLLLAIRKLRFKLRKLRFD